jgi:hypothetical protein
MLVTLEMYPQVRLSSVGKKALLNEWELMVKEAGKEAFEQALSDHVRDSEFFPSPGALRKRLGMRKEDQDQVEALAAWDFALNYVHRHWTPDLGACSFAGKPAPAIPPRTDYAIRQVGGLRALFYLSKESEPFTRKEFVEAYRLAPVYEQMRPQLDSQFAPKELSAGVRGLIAGKAMDGDNPTERRQQLQQQKVELLNSEVRR